jgi:hypothetical protein
MTSGSRLLGSPYRTKVASTSNFANNWSATALSCPALMESLVLTPRFLHRSYNWFMRDSNLFLEYHLGNECRYDLVATVDRD